MLFNSYEFILLFLPITLLGFYLTSRLGSRRSPIFWLITVSFFFYGWWNPPYLLLLFLSIGVNYALGQVLNQAHLTENENRGKFLLVLGVVFNLGLIGYYKYFNFFIDNVNALVGTSFSIAQIILPLGISFYTFQQISYLMDSMEGETRHYRFLDYCLFVTFFPQLIAGPIVNHDEMMPQFSKQSKFGLNQDDVAVGLSIFSIGLFKKVILADQIALYSTPVFNAASQGVPLSMPEAWMGALAYTMQIYFDFSGYSDMAIGAARLFGIKLPLNFNSPYKAINIIDFWGRWHMTLTRFLTRYLYNPIALNFSRRRMRQGKSLIKRGVGSFGAFIELIATPTIITMFLAGLWHGAGWQYIAFGFLHGFYLTVNHGWHMILKSRGYNLKKVNWLGQRIGQGITFLAVVVAMIFFRAPSVDNAMTVIASMLGTNGFALTDGAIFPNQLFPDNKAGVLGLAVLMVIVFYFPNTQQWMARFEPGLNFNPVHELQHHPRWLTIVWKNSEWRPTVLWAGLTSAIAVIAFLGLSQVSEFIYFQF
ncbi:MAG: MBOAT family O-acyltransferase [Elainellaceae cyanobacterium]